ncbi:hydratase [Bradyrhizobium sp. CCGUVB1N3]|uniref:carbon-nitrogen hydrolase family protein n=1 Tax=Bradyrhizobium sp. CCGUVB1N3 TaxID=2949629 RepID=UPI0020B2AE64|nr:nitrilase-related carbon-nitrogen hydrolase [Bradyrhizobium sp. CCGUVB1N3]MCP3476741.1 hydratase [Bradyrhizobium sp. CCGUVB1N3]
MKIAVAQFRAEAFKPQANRERAVGYVEGAARRGARLVVLPELVVSGYALDAERLAEVAEAFEGPTLKRWTSAASEHGVLIAGGFCEKSNGKLYNSAMLVGPSGPLLHYRKLHLFDRERRVFSPGDLGLPVAKTEIGTVGLCVCYDLRFVEVARLLSLQGADLLAVPTAWVGGFDRTTHDKEGFITQARGAVVQANLNQVYVACASQSGVLGDQRFLGNSLVVDPFGRVLAGPLDEASEQLMVVEYDPDAAAAARHRSELVNPRDDRRTDVYAVKIGDRVL